MQLILKEDIENLGFQDETIFQAFDVNHEVGPDYWNTKINGKMRASLAGLFKRTYTLDEKIGNLTIFFRIL